MFRVADMMIIAPLSLSHQLRYFSLRDYQGFLHCTSLTALFSGYKFSHHLIKRCLVGLCPSASPTYPTLPLPTCPALPPYISYPSAPYMSCPSALHILPFRSLHVLPFRSLHVLPFRSLHILPFRSLHVPPFRSLHILPFRSLHILPFRLPDYPLRIRSLDGPSKSF